MGTASIRRGVDWLRAWWCNGWWWRGKGARPLPAAGDDLRVRRGTPPGGRQPELRRAAMRRYADSSTTPDDAHDPDQEGFWAARSSAEQDNLRRRGPGNGHLQRRCRVDDLAGSRQSRSGGLTCWRWSANGPEVARRGRDRGYLLSSAVSGRSRRRAATSSAARTVPPAATRTRAAISGPAGRGDHPRRDKDRDDARLPDAPASPSKPLASPGPAATRDAFIELTIARRSRARCNAPVARRGERGAGPARRIGAGP